MDSPPPSGDPIPVRRQVSLARWLRENRAAIVPLALLVGAGTGVGAIVFRWLITAVTRMFTGYADYSAVGRVASTHVPFLGVWFLLLVPVAAGLVYGPLVYLFAPEARGHGVPEVMYAVAQRGGRIPPQVSVVKALASALCIGGGGSVGREGPIVQIGSALGSTVGRVSRMGAARMRMLVACGAAGGIAATFNAPLAGSFFAMELILREFTAESFGAVVLSAVTASVIGRAVLGDAPFLSLPSFSVDRPTEYLLFLLLGVVGGVIGMGFSRVLYLIEDLCDWAWRGPQWLRPAAGGVLLGAVLLALPQLYGVGYPVLENAVEGRYAVWLLVLLLVGKMLATSLTIGIGGSGGVFAPTLFIGAMAGTAFGDVVHAIAPGMTEPAGAYGLIGMGAVLAGATRAPITSVVILFEITGEYSIILPLMAAVALAAGTGHLLGKDTIYTRKLLRRGIDLDGRPAAPVFGDMTVAQVATAVPTPLPLTSGLTAAARALAAAGSGVLPVLSADGAYRGCVTARAVAEALADSLEPDGDLAMVIEHPPVVLETDRLAEVVHTLADYPGAGLPVLAADRSRLTGWVSHGAVLGAIGSAGGGPPEPG